MSNPSSIPASLREKIAKAQKNIQSRGSKFLFLESGKPLTVRVLPGEWGEEGLWYRQTGLHYFGNWNCGCHQLINGTPCVICSHLEELKGMAATVKVEIDDLKRQGGDTKAKDVELAEIEKIIDELKPSKKWSINVLVRGESKPRIFTAPWGIFETLFSTFATNVENESMDIFDVNMGYDFEFKKEGQGMTGTTYSAQIQLKPKPLVARKENANEPDEEAIKQVLAQRYNLDQEVQGDSETEVREKFEKWMADPSSKPEDSKDQRPKQFNRTTVTQPQHPVTATQPVTAPTHTAATDTAKPTSAAATLAARLRGARA